LLFAHAAIVGDRISPAVPQRFLRSLRTGVN
jgi:hypothetical protein